MEMLRNLELSRALIEGMSWSLVFLSIFFLLTGLDDAFVDLYAWFHRSVPRFLTERDLEEMRQSPQKNIAIIVPAWDESAIIRRMLMGNRKRIDYERYHFFVGCYPNDQSTVEEVHELASIDPKVHVIENFRDGPTCKGQILNWVVDSILDWEREAGEHFDAFLMQDSEDVIHEKALQLINVELDDADYVQIPVFSQPLSPRSIVAGVYVDEFAEAHTKDVIVRSYLGGGVPSAGVGTALSRRFIMQRKLGNKGVVFRDGSLTEDYELGVTAAVDGAKQKFSAAWFKDPLSQRSEFIATREYFPKSVTRSIRQKTRWTIGIALQGWRFLGWRGSAVQKYFLYRDRRGLITNPLTLLGYVWVLVFLLLCLPDSGNAAEIFDRGAVRVTCSVTALFAVNRLMQRFVCVVRVYGWKTALLIPLRFPVGNFINGAAVVNAIIKDTRSRLFKRQVTWSKTHHELPESFGIPIPLQTDATSRTAISQRGQ